MQGLIQHVNDFSRYVSRMVQRFVHDGDQSIVGDKMSKEIQMTGVKRLTPVFLARLDPACISTTLAVRSGPGFLLQELIIIQSGEVLPHER